MKHRWIGVAVPTALAAFILLVPAGSSACAQSAPASGSGAAGAQLQENVARSWYRNFEYGIEMDGKGLPDAGLYQIVGRPYMLIFGTSLDSAWVLSFEPKVVKQVRRDQVTARGDLEVMLAESSFASSPPIPWMQDGPSAVVFYAGQKRLRIARVPPLLGPTTVEEMFTHNPMYRRGAEEYQPKADAIAALKRVQGKVAVEVWYGSWCPHCLQVVPQFVKIVESAGNPNIDVVYHAVPRDFGTYAPSIQRDIKGLPTFIFLKNGKEIGRIRGGPTQGTLEDEVAGTLKTAGQPSGS